MMWTLAEVQKRQTNNFYVLDWAMYGESLVTHLHTAQVMLVLNAGLVLAWQPVKTL